MAKHLVPPDGGAYVPGFRAWLRERHARQAERGDPRVPYVTDDPAERRRINEASSVVRQARRMLERLDAGEDVEDWPPSLRRWPELAGVSWSADPSVRRVVVSADDTVRPIYD